MQTHSLRCSMKQHRLPQETPLVSTYSHLGPRLARSAPLRELENGSPSPGKARRRLLQPYSSPCRTPLRLAWTAHSLPLGGFQSGLQGSLQPLGWQTFYSPNVRWSNQPIFFKVLLTMLVPDPISCVRDYGCLDNVMSGARRSPPYSSNYRAASRS